MSRWHGRIGVFFLGVALGVVVSAATVAIRRAVSPRQPSSSYVERFSLFSVLSPRPGDVVFAGDSLIANGEWAELLEAPCVRHRGVGRETVAGLLRRADAVAAGSPTAVFLMVGINDLLDGRSAESLEPDYVALLSSLRAGAPATAVVVQSVLPIGPPMPGKGDCYDNACAESFFSSLKNELTWHTRYQNRAEAKSAIFECIEIFYNRERSHQGLDYTSPVRYEEQGVVP